ncbi:MAG: response regulator [Anaerolineae bacterium]|jgi:DNA-binding response OmpR family regulator
MARILIIDDDPSGTQLLITLLGFEGYEGLKPENWRDLVADVDRLRPDLVLMDVRLRTLDGILLLRELREQPDPELARIPVLMMSAEDHRRRCMAAGANGFIEKPFDRIELLDTIENILKGGSLDD